jgi:hypothetical protein
MCSARYFFKLAVERQPLGGLPNRTCDDHTNTYPSVAIRLYCDSTALPMFGARWDEAIVAVLNGGRLTRSLELFI